MSTSDTQEVLLCARGLCVFRCTRMHNAESVKYAPGLQASQLLSWFLFSAGEVRQNKEDSYVVSFFP